MNKYRTKYWFRKNKAEIFAVLGGIVFVACIIWYSLWYYSMPLSDQIELRCMRGDSVACLSVPGK
jgi:hypothetical protein